MLDAAPVLVLSLAYLGALFAIASWGDRRADRGRSVIGNPWIYTLSLAVYCTAWTFYGSVGLAGASAASPSCRSILGPTIGGLLFTFLLHKMVQDRQGLRHHVDRRLHRRPLRQERRCWRAWSRSWPWSAPSPTSRSS